MVRRPASGERLPGFRAQSAALCLACVLGGIRLAAAPAAGRRNTLDDRMIEEIQGVASPAVPAAPVVRHENGRVWIEGVPDWPAGAAWDAVLRGVQSLLAARGKRVSLNELMAFSGDAFNLCHASRWQGAAYLCIPTDPVANLASVYGFEYACLHSGDETGKLAGIEPPERRQVTLAVLRRIRSEIEAGRPVLVGGADTHDKNWSVVTGCDRDPPRLLHPGIGDPDRWLTVRGFAGNPVYAEDEKNGVNGFWDGRPRGAVRQGFVGGRLCNPAYVLGKAVPAPMREISVREALRRAVVLFQAPAHRVSRWGGVEYSFGETAYRRWAEDLRRLDYPADLKKERPRDAIDWYEMGNMDTQIDQVIRGRTAAAEFCEHAAGLLPEAAVDLARAADRYLEEAGLAEQAFAPFIPAHRGNMQARESWLADPAERRRGAEAIGKMLENERLAVGRLESALKKLENLWSPVPSQP